MPSNPATMLEVAGEQNGLTSPDLNPWYLKATYSTFDEHGQPKDTGVYEEWWAAPTKYKRRYTSKSFSLTEYVTDTGTYGVSDRSFTPLAESLLPERLQSPIPSAKDYEQPYLMRRKQTFGNVELECVLLGIKMPDVESAPTGLFPTYCFNENKPILRWSGSFVQYDTLYNQILVFQKKYVAQDITVTEGADRRILTAHVETLGVLATVNESDFVPPVNATKPPYGQALPVSSGLMQTYVLKKTPPIYPGAAKENRIQGTVTLQVEIGEDGHIHQMKVESAPHPLLAIAALEAVKSWEYKPYLFNGKPIRVKTQINVVFKLG